MRRVVASLSSYLILGAATVGAAPCAIEGTITSRGVPLPGVVITLTDSGSRVVESTSSAPDGSFGLAPQSPGTYRLTAGLTAFAPLERDITIDGTCGNKLDLTMTLASRSSASPPPVGGTTATSAAAPRPTLPGPGASRVNPPNRDPGQTPAGRPPFQTVPLVANAVATAGRDDGWPNEASESAAAPLLPPGFSVDAAADSIATLGNARASDAFAFGGRFDGDRPGNPFDRPEGFDAGGFGAGRGGPGPGGPGPGGFGPGGGFGRPGGPGGFGARTGRQRLRGMGFQSFDSSALDAAPFSLNGQPTRNADYLQQRFGATLGGPFRIPKMYSDGGRTFFFLNYSGTHSRTPYDAYATVPTAAVRAGDLSGMTALIVDPTTGQPFPGNQIPEPRRDPAALALLDLFPLPNQPGTRQNFHYVTTTTNQVDDVNFRLVHNFGDAAQGPRGGAPARGGGPGGPRRDRPGNLTIAIHYRHSEIGNPNVFSTLGGTSNVQAWDIPVGYSFRTFGLQHSIRFQLNRQRSDASNLFAFSQNIAGLAGVLGASSDPFDWGAPNLSFSNVTSLVDGSPSLRTNQTLALGDSIVKTYGDHGLRFGGDYRDIRLDSRVDQNARGSFVFTGLFTGFDFGDFLLGLPQQASIQYGAGLERFRARSWDAYLQDDWRPTGTMTVNLGVRYEYVSPYSEAANRLVTLDAPGNFAAAVPVLAGGTGPFSGTFPDTIVRPDRNNVAPRVAVAWRGATGTIVRAGYGINYSAGAYAGIAEQLAAQPPFAFASTILASPASLLPLESALLLTPTGLTTNSYAVDPAFRVGLVHMWTFDVQRDLTRTINVGLGYIGTTGGDLQVVRAPNRTPDGLRISGVLPFLWVSSPGASNMHSLTLRIRKRLSAGLGAGASYTLSKSIDDASSIGEQRSSSRRTIRISRPSGVSRASISDIASRPTSCTSFRLARTGAGRITGGPRRPSRDGCSTGTRSSRPASHTPPACSARSATSPAASTERCAPTTTGCRLRSTTRPRRGSSTRRRSPCRLAACSETPVATRFPDPAPPTSTSG